MTVVFTVRYLKPVPLDREVRALARITRDSTRLFEGSGEIVLDDGTVAVQASGRYMKMSIDRIVDDDFSQQWFADPRETPADADI